MQASVIKLVDLYRIKTASKPLQERNFGIEKKINNRRRNLILVAL